MVSVPTLVPPAERLTEPTPTSSEALTVTVTVPETVAPSEGAVKLTLGAVVSLLLTARATAADASTRP